jgi:hypothetical protein
MNNPPPAPEKEKKKSRSLENLKSGLRKLSKSYSSSTRRMLSQRTPSNITRATGEYTLKIAKLRFPKGYKDVVKERYDTIPIEYLQPSFLVPRYQQNLENERYKQRKQATQEELASESEKGILNAKNVIW